MNIDLPGKIPTTLGQRSVGKHTRNSQMNQSLVLPGIGENSVVAGGFFLTDIESSGRKMSARNVNNSVIVAPKKEQMSPLVLRN